MDNSYTMEGGILYIDKEEGMTSREVDNAIQRLFHTRRVGHLGTLDPFATGLLIVAVNEATKCLPYYDDDEKTYIAELRLGESTETGDMTGAIKERKPVPSLSRLDIEKRTVHFIGPYLQVPPMTSAIRKDGKHLYELAHKGIEVAREPIERIVYILDILSYEEPYVTIKAKVSKGTYIRTLGEDMANSLGTVGHLTSLRRIAIGKTSVEGSIKLDQVSKESLRDPFALLPYRRVILPKDIALKARNGVKLEFDDEEDRLFVLDEENKPIALYEREEGKRYRVLRGLA